MPPKSANEQKASEGVRSSEGPVEVTGSGSTIGFNENNFKRIEGKPALNRLRTSSNGTEVETDFWNAVVNGLNDSTLTRILMISQADSAYDMTGFIRGIEYQGFDRLFYIKHALSKMSVSVFCRFAVIGAIRGSNFQKISETCDNMPGDLTSAYNTLGIVKTPKKRTDLTILRNTASIPHWCAYWSNKANIEKKIPSSNCNAALQFPGAASLPMSQSVRRDHLKFCVEFSRLLPGGRFNMNIYLVAMKNEIPVKDIPQEVLNLLELSANTESYRLTENEITEYGETRALIRA